MMFSKIYTEGDKMELFEQNSKIDRIVEMCDHLIAHIEAYIVSRETLDPHTLQQLTASLKNIYSIYEDLGETRPVHVVIDDEIRELGI